MDRVGRLLFESLAFPSDGGSPALLADDAQAVVNQVLGLASSQRDIATHLTGVTASITSFQGVEYGISAA